MELQPIIANAWHQLTTEERAGYDTRAAQETLSYGGTAQVYVQLFHEYETLAGELACESLICIACGVWFNPANQTGRSIMRY